MLGAVSEYQRRSAKERNADAQANAVARGIPPWPNIPPGYRREIVGTDQKGNPIYDGPLLRDPQTAPAVTKAFQMRADGATVAKIREYLADNGIKRSYHGVGALLASRVVLGEIHFGKLSNLEAPHPAIVDREVWQRVQRVRVSRGRRAKSDRLLARLGVLRCGSCGARMVVASAHHGQYPMYRCPPNGDCKRHVSISAELVEGIVTDAVRKRIANVKGRASAEQNIRDAEQALADAQGELDAAMRVLEGFEDELSARRRLLELREARDAAQEHLDTLGGPDVVVTLDAATDWERLTLHEQREIIRATIERVTVAPGRGAERVAVELV
jgi:hypothetical protein